MNIDSIIRAVRAEGKASAYKIVQDSRHSSEWYFVKGTPDMARSIDSSDFSLTVYVDSGADGAATRGAFTTRLNPGMDEAELTRSVAKACRQAAGMANPWYPITDPTPLPKTIPVSGFEGKSPEASLEGLRSALYSPEAGSGASINSLELFLARKETRIVNSLGVDVSFVSWTGFTEFIVTAKESGREEVELSGCVSFSEPDYQKLAKSVRDTLYQARDRLSAVPTPPRPGLPVLFRGDLAGDLYDYWFHASQAQAAYEKTSPFAVGAMMGSGDGDFFTLKAVPHVPGVPGSRPYDNDGFPLAETDCIISCRLTRLVAPTKYAHYLKIPASGDLPLFELAPGTRTEAELAAIPHLEAAAFSDFFVDPTTGDFGGELRLGYLSENGKRYPVTGGSVSGNLRKNLGGILLSGDLETKKRCLGPVFCLLPLASIATAE